MPDSYFFTQTKDNLTKNRNYLQNLSSREREQLETFVSDISYQPTILNDPI